MNRKLLSLPFLVLALLLSSCQPNPFNGQWTLQAQVEQVSAPECSSSFLGSGDRLYLGLTQEGAALSGFPILFPGPNAVMDEGADWKVLGETNAAERGF